jgi:hypothetical protein
MFPCRREFAGIGMDMAADFAILIGHPASTRFPDHGLAAVFSF